MTAARPDSVRLENGNCLQRGSPCRDRRPSCRGLPRCQRISSLCAIQSLEFTLGCNSKLIARVDAFRKKRNISDYERAGSVSDREVEEISTLATELHSQLLDWLRNSHPELIPPQE